MPVEKFSISLPEDLVAEIDDFAKADGVTRSGFVREVMGEYVTKRRSAAWEGERRERIGRAIEGMRSLAAELGKDPRPSLEILHEIREESARGYSGEGDGDE